MKKLFIVLMLAMVVLIFSGSFVQARPPGNWVEFATIHGQNVGEADIIKIYYDADTLRISDFVQNGIRFRSVHCHIWQEGRLWWDYIRLENNRLVGGWVYYSESNRYPLRTGGTTIQPMPIPKGSVLHQLLNALYSPDGQLRKEINEISEKNGKRDEEMRQASLKRQEEKKRVEEEMRQARLKREEEDMKQAEENLMEAIREGKKRRVDWKYVDVYSHYKNPGELYDPRSNMTKEEYESWQRIRNKPGPCPYGWGEEECAKKKFFNLYQGLEDGKGGPMSGPRLK